MKTGKYELVIKWPSGQGTLCGEISDDQYGEVCRILSPDYPAKPSPTIESQMWPYAPGIAEDIERSDWTPEEALRWYAAGKHFDTADNHTRIIDTGAIASNALKHASLQYLELKGDAELSALRAELSAIKGGGEAVAWRVSHPETKWEVYKSFPRWAIGYGFVVEPLYTRPPVVTEPVRSGIASQVLKAQAEIETWPDALRKLYGVQNLPSPETWLAAPPASGAVPVPRELLEQTIQNLMYGSSRENAAELRALLANGVV